ncbi:PglZ domain-containing protein [Actinoplanes flavus]|uniref:PglZ domain-containing protein n=1 Tax=Actinoplanes flavus TaxID=2820290 RepID=A0ABS3UM19_9ACTN|nr:PglZ domain-containing protein [Actinoplanes flavus]MBO3739496.1 PglZ domain-containing protein [Actinoplanes flavus]
MDSLYDYIAKKLAEEVTKRGVVIWYDAGTEFAPFIAELRGGPRTGEAVPVTLYGKVVRLAEYAGSMFEVRFAVEPYVREDSPEPAVIYLPGCDRDTGGSVLMELERAGMHWEPRLAQLAKELLLKRHTIGVVDSMVAADRRLSYEDFRKIAADEGAGSASVLKSIFARSHGDDTVLADWLADDSRDSEIAGKSATGELIALVQSWLGLRLPGDGHPSKLRSITLRYVLAGEFRADLSCASPPALDGVPVPPTPDADRAVRELAVLLRSGHAQVYPALADLVERELGLSSAAIPAEALGTIDTFRFEERVLLKHCGDLVADGRFEAALTLVSQRADCYWLHVDVARKAQWEAIRRMAELGQVAIRVGAEIKAANGDVGAWFGRYTAAGGWHRLDQAQRRLEAWITELDDVQEQPLAVVRRAYEDTCHRMADRFTKALAGSGWAVPRALHQTRVFSEVVASQPKPVAYLLVDAMRFEMGLELAERLPDKSEVSVRPAVGALPSITPVGMAALQPGAAASFSLADKGGRLGAQIDGTFLADRAARGRFAKARIPDLVDLALNDVLSLPVSRLTKKVEGAQVVIVRSQEIDHAGENGFAFHARQVMDTVIDNLARAIRRLANAGIRHAVVTADHGHLFFATDRDESMRIDAPGGDTVDLHRRCWVGRGGANPPGTVRISAATLGYTSDLDLVFPAGAGVFKAGGDLAFHHGGPSLQELVIPVVTVRAPAPVEASSATAPVAVEGAPNEVTNRIFTVTLALGGQHQLLPEVAEEVVVRPVLIADGQQVGVVGMVVDAKFDVAAQRVRLEPGQRCTLAFRLVDDAVGSLRIVVQDPETDAELYRSPSDIPVRLGVS